MKQYQYGLQVYVRIRVYVRIKVYVRIRADIVRKMNHTYRTVCYCQRSSQMSYRHRCNCKLAYRLYVQSEIAHINKICIY